MANMSYCRFENTASDLADCLENWDDEDLSASESSARKRILAMANDIVSFYGDPDDDF